MLAEAINRPPLAGRIACWERRPQGWKPWAEGSCPFGTKIPGQVALFYLGQTVWQQKFSGCAGKFRCFLKSYPARSKRVAVHGV